jgi:transcriptional regulator with GAF, ATPase, and Fis domain
MEENEREHIITVLKQCSWKLHGPGGAAELLRINEFTLRSRMKKLGIIKEKPVRKE